MGSKVWFLNVQKVIPGKGLNDQLDALFQEEEFNSFVGRGDSVAVKINTGELFADTYIRPSHIRKVVDNIKRLEGIPFIAEATPLYLGGRHTSSGLIEAAAINGFTSASMECPVVCADGPNVTRRNPFNGEGVTMELPDGVELKQVEIASAFARADAMMVCANISPGIGVRSIMKHIGMGCSTKKGKSLIHEVSKPKVDPNLCTGCGSCQLECAWDAISIEDGPAVIDYTKCVGCMTCFEACHVQGTAAIDVLEEDGLVRRQIRVVEAAATLLRAKRNKLGFMGFLIGIKGECECHSYSRREIVPDIGILASRDPVSLDSAAYELINQAPGIPGSVAEGYGPGTQKLKIWPQYDFEAQIRRAEDLGLGTREYELLEI